MKIGQNGTYKHVLDVLMENTPPTVVTFGK